MDATKFYDQMGNRYIKKDQKYSAAYHEVRLTTARELLRKFSAFRGGRLFDFGCGSGEFFELAIEDGYAAAGCDISPVMVDLARKLCPDVMVGGNNAFEQSKGPFDAIVAVNVLPYLSLDEERHFYQLARDRIANDGLLVVSHTNWLFDLVTFNRYTIDFFRDYLLPTLGLDKVAMENTLQELKSVLSFPDYPNDGDLKSERDTLPKRRVDPFIYPGELKDLGWTVVQEEYINCFPVPPKIVNAHEPLRLARLNSHSALSSPTLKRIFCSQFQYAMRKSAP